MILLLLVILIFFPGAFSLSALDFGSLLVLTVFILLIPSVIWLLNKLLEGGGLLLNHVSGGKYAE